MALKEVQQHYRGLLEQERIDKAQRLAELDAEARDAASFSQQEVAKVRLNCEHKIESLEAEAQRQVDAIERERLQLVEAHRQKLLELEQQTAREREETELKLQEIARQMQVSAADTDSKVAQLVAERDTAMKGAWQHCTDAEFRADEKCREALKREQDATARSRAMIREAEARRSQHSLEVQRSFMSVREHADKVIVETQQRVAERLAELIQEAKMARELLEKNRGRADSHMRAHLQAQIDATDAERARVQESLIAARQQFFEAGISAHETATQSAAEIEARNRERVMGLSGKVADELQARSADTHWLDALQQPRYVQGLEELAHKLRSGSFWRPIPPQVHPAIGSKSRSPSRVPPLAEKQYPAVYEAAAEGAGISSTMASNWGHITGPNPTGTVCPAGW